MTHWLWVWWQGKSVEEFSSKSPSLQLANQIQLWAYAATFSVITVATSPVALRWMCDSRLTGCVRKITPIYTWHEKAITEWSRRVISFVACCHSAKLCALAARASRSQHYQWPPCWISALTTSLAQLCALNHLSVATYLSVLEQIQACRATSAVFAGRGQSFCQHLNVSEFRHHHSEAGLHAGSF